MVEEGRAKSGDIMARKGQREKRGRSFKEKKRGKEESMQR